MRFASGVALACSAAAAVANANDIVVNRVVDDFPWSDPFGEHSTPPGYKAICEATGTFHARQHLLSELQLPEPKGLQPWANALKYFFGGRPFPGSWDGVDEHGQNRDVILMNYTALPEAVKLWMQRQKEDKNSDGMWLFGLYHKNREGIKIKGTATARPRPTATPTAGEEVEIDSEAARLPPDENLVVMFAAGALYHVLPLWVAQGSDCEADLLNLDKYGPTLKDGGVAAWVVEHTRPGTGSEPRDITFTVKAQVLKETDEGRAARTAREREEAEASVVAAASAKEAEAAETGKPAESEDATKEKAKEDVEKDEL